MPHVTSDDDWEAESDIRALEQAEEIKRDPSRVARAKRRAEEMAAVAQAKVTLIDEKAQDSLSQGFRKL